MYIVTMILEILKILEWKVNFRIKNLILKLKWIKYGYLKGNLIVNNGN